MGTYAFESLLFCAGLRVDGDGMGLRGISSVWSPESPALMLFARARGTKPPDGLLYEVSIHHFSEEFGATLVWRRVIRTDQRHRLDRAINLYGAYFPERGLERGVYTGTIELVTGESVQSSLVVE